MVEISKWLLFVIVAFCSHSNALYNNTHVTQQFATNNNVSKTLLNDYDEWIASNVVMPRSGQGLAVGAYSNSIYLLGGINEELQLVRYDITTNKMVDFGGKHLTSPVSGDGQFYSVSNNILYIIDSSGSGSKVTTFDLRTASFARNYINIPYNVGIGSCIASTATLLYVVGGANPVNHDTVATSNKLQIFSTKSNKWTNSPSSMQQSRNYLTCNIYQQNNVNKLYAIGGYNQNNQRTVYLNSVEYIFPTETYSHWQYISGHLLYPTISARSVIYKTSILVIGGQYYDDRQSRHYLDVIQIIDMNTGIITAGGRLANPIENTAVVMVNQVIYAFGGFYGHTINQWQYSRQTTPTNAPTRRPTQRPTEKPTNAPTNAPTYSPTNPPTNPPTNEPTDSPTNSPTKAPTNTPTSSPTNAPTNSPTNAPTNSPTNTPTTSPTNSPTNTPTNAPIKAPTNSPSDAPTAAPTKDPTPLPTNAPNNAPTNAPTKAPSNYPTGDPTSFPTKNNAKSNSATSLLIPLLTIIIIVAIMLLCCWFTWLRPYLKRKRSAHGSNLSAVKQAATKLFEPLKSIQISSQSKLNEIDYVPMATIDEENSLRSKEMRQHDIVDNLLFEEQLQINSNKKQDEQKNVVIFRGAR